MKLQILFFAFTFIFLNTKAQNTPLYVGTFTNEASKGIYQLQFNTETGELGNLELAINIDNPSFLAYSPDKNHLYSAHKDGFVSSYKVNKNGKLSLLTRVSSHGKGACHVAVNKSGDKAIVSNYGTGTATILPVNKNGSISEATQVFNKNSENKKSRAHSGAFLNNELYVAYLGKNAIYSYELSDNKDKYEETSKSIVETTGNPGPRHFTFTKDGKFIYIINELASTITSARKVKNGYKLIDNISTLDEKFKDENFCADIHLSHDERFLYGSNRGENAIAVFKRNKKTGTLKKIQNISVHGDWPRNFTIDPTGKFMLVANQKSNNISVFKIDSKTGKLSFLDSINAPSPVCLLF
ncbi:hypothetical protein A8C32_09605 [Flavivirga aquatica]|uniref:6-phosphogluconolactonase n=1 Tax=Flavivirga aquatica TaxID=1849968 RepID=A0A1E5TEU8_9FLAO|nr:lactonase family protein [Flavivirga aquatica]OEK09895.1 hypothetical protein A8C32_09605 [Flavivirga aquatica]